MEPQSFKHPKLTSKSLFWRVHKYLKKDYKMRKLSIDEFFMLFWLSTEADYEDGLVSADYEGISIDLDRKYSKNEVNKICLSLREKGYIWFQKQPGRRGPAVIAIRNYPLPGGRFNEIRDVTCGNDRAESEVPAEVREEQQRLNSDIYGLVKSKTIRHNYG